MKSKQKSTTMRRTLLMIMAVALLLTQCRKPEVKFPSPVAPEGTTVSMTVTAGPGSKTDITAAGAITWSEGDKLYVGDGAKYIGCLTLQGAGGSATGTFSGNVTLPNGTTDDQTFHFFYLGSNPPAVASGASSVEVSFATQEIYAEYGKLKNASKHHVGYGSAKGTVAGSEVTGINVALVSKVALARFSFKKNSTDYTDALTLSGTNIYNSMTVGFGGSFNHGTTPGSISLTGSHSERYVMLVPTGATTAQTLTFTGSSEDGTGDVPGLQSNKFYGKTDAIPVNLTAPAPTHETVNMGLPEPYDKLEWATCNLGATNGETKESWYGDYYQWGGVTSVTSTDINVGWAGCPFTNDTYSSSNKKVFTKYIPEGKPEYWAGEDDPDNKLVLESSDDAATVAWGSDWRMPTTEEWKSLYDNNTFEWLAAGATSTKVTSFKAVAAGYLVVKGGKNSIALDASVYMFLPAAGYRDGTSLSNAGSYGSYWSSSLYSSYPYRAYIMYFCSDDVYPQYNYNRYYGCTVRPVRPAL